MKCSECHQTVDSQLYWQAYDEKTGQETILCDVCFQKLNDEDDDMADVVCAICHRTLDEDEEYLEEDQTGDCYCLPCFEKHKEALLRESQKY